MELWTGAVDLLPRLSRIYGYLIQSPEGRSDSLLKVLCFNYFQLCAFSELEPIQGPGMLDYRPLFGTHINEYTSL